MKRILPILLLALACPFAWAFGAPAARALGAAPQPIAPVSIAGPRPAAAWLATGQRGPRVQVAWPPAAPALQVGPGGAGSDGAPAMASANDDGLLVVAARRDGDRARLWSQAASAAGWQPATWLPAGNGVPSAPALALRGARGWAVWHSAGAPDSDLMAAEWRGDAWSAPEILPRVGGAPGLPALALDGGDQPVVLWSESDGTDAEIWVSRRGRDRWSRPRRLSRNAVPDILPSIAGDGDRLVAAWSRLEEGRYYAAAVAFGDGRTWERAQRLSPGPAAGVTVAAAVPATVTWSELTGAGTARRITGAEQINGNWRTLGGLGTAINARHHAMRRGGDLTIAWHQRDGVAVATARAERGWESILWRGSRTASGRPREAVAPDTYLAFGDSITTGLAQTNGVISFVTPYTDHLQEWTSDYLGEMTLVANEGLAGEFTAEGVERIPFTLQGQRLTLILEGANDMYNRFDPLTVATNLRLMVHSAATSGSIPVLSNVMPVTGLNFGDGRNLAISELNVLLQAVAIEEGAILVDMHSTFFGRPALYSDDLHPNEFGYKEMAKAWFRGIKPLLDQWLLEQDIEFDGARDKALGRSRPAIRGGE